MAILTSTIGNFEYDLEEFEYVFEPGGYKGKIKTCVFKITISSNEQPYYFDVPFWYMVEESERFAPEQHAYIERLAKHVNSISDDELSVIQALEAEGFDFTAFVQMHMDNLPADELERAIPITIEIKVMLSKDEPGIAEITEHAPETPKKEKPLNEFDQWAFMDYLTEKYFESAKKALYASFKNIKKLPEEELEQLHEFVLDYAYAVGQNGAKVTWLAEKLSEPSEQMLINLKEFEPESIRAEAMEMVKGHDRNKDFTIEIVDYENEWNLMGENTMRIYVRIDKAEGFGYDYVNFRYIRAEACVNFPELYQRILELEDSIDAMAPKEPEVLSALLLERWDLIPVIHSYAARNLNIILALKIQEIAAERNKQPMGEYYDYQERKALQAEPDSCSKWFQSLAKCEDKILREWMPILKEECSVIFEVEDYRIAKYAIHELTANLSNMFHDLGDEFEMIADEEVIRPS